MAAFIWIDLIDMRHMPDNGQHWILHAIDHWSKFNFALPLPQKSVECVSGALQTHIFSVIAGLPSILRSNSLIKEIVATWPDHVQMMSGRPRHPRSQGLVELAHYTLERIMNAKIVQYLHHGLNGFHLVFVSESFR